MTIPLVPATVATDDLSTISASTVNSWRANMAKAIDGVGGSAGVPSTPATQIDIGGSGLKLSNGNRLDYNSRTITRAQTSPLQNVTASNAVSLAGFIAIAPAETGKQIVRAPNGAVLASLTVYIDRQSSGASPGTKVTVSLERVRITSGAQTTIAGPTTDPAADGAAYNDHHGIVLTPGSTETVNSAENIYVLNITGEAGGGTTATVTWFGCTATYTITTQDEAP